ncbi:hypothetical protein TPHA_0F03320 [Tetrapisispora phaffii CBS 4417]|uniref:Enolase-phosphatase E1 n=1 Tax=Tetrapisispora phaffii (strain ATCC 24235 / CBS 4417 / NBRC 1672 / NRRL Y-8282 / UCD 70-5) TaxID=1071381 RepID=G8BUM7_TETPH|nr:hypothetical protein TPHA_0F03320 [Tetrapisispora phaffii CBS 4417]CCE63813.1 hypothetical protein TPHA_0F03320 [Tetrapisispora phaffii CBS 4417]
MTESRRYILDIEGTVCPISFVKSELFPYFLEQLADVILNVHKQDATIQGIVAKFGITDSTALLVHIRRLVEADVKDPVLKELQGYVWSRGYHSGDIKAPVYPDAIGFIKDPRNKIYIYSSGSVKAQKLLFRFVKDADTGTVDLTPHILGYYDITTSGRKIDPQSYRNIVSDINSIESTNNRESTFLFLSDNTLEIDAANEAGLSTRLVIREGNQPIPAEKLSTYHTIHSCHELQ